MLRLKRIQNEIGLTAYHWKIFGLAGSGWMFDNLFFQMIAIILPQLQKEFSLSGFRIGLPQLGMYLGAMLGNLIFGYASDRFGRKPCFLITLLISSLAAFLIALTVSLESLLAGTFLLGVGVGGGLPVDGNLLLESIPPAKESLLALLSCFWPVGQVVAAAFALVILPISSCADQNKCNFANNQSWRIFCLVIGSLSFIGFFFRVLLTVEESPAFLYSQGKFEDCYRSVERTTDGANGLNIILDDFLLVCQEEEEGEGVSDEDETRDEFSSSEESTLISSKPQPTNSYKSLFKRPHLKTTLVMLLVWSCLGLGFNIFHGFLPEFLQNQKNGSNHPRSITETYRFYMITSICGVPGSFVALIASNLKCIGSKPTLIISTLLTSLCLLLVVILTDDAGQLFASCLEAFTSTIVYGLLYFITPLTFPVHLRGKGFGLCSAVSRLVGSLAPLLAGILFEISTKLPFIFSGFFLFSSFLLMFFIDL